MDDILKGKKVLVISADDVSKPADRQQAELQAVSTAFFQPFAEAVYNTAYKKINKTRLQQLQKKVEVYPLSALKQAKSLNWDKYDVVIGAGIDVATFITDGEITFKQIRDILYRKNVLAGLNYWGILSPWKLVQMFQFPEDPSNQEEFVQLYRSVRDVYEHLTGDPPVSTMTRSKILTCVKEVEKLVEYCKLTGEATYDFETLPEKPGLTSKDDLLTHSTETHLAKPSMLSISFQPGSAWLVPLFHHESPFDCGQHDCIELVETEEGTEVHKNGQTHTRYNGTTIYYTELNKAYIDALIDNIDYCKQNGINSLIKEVVIPNLIKLFNDPEIRNTAHNYKFDKKLLTRWFGVTHMLGRQDDTMMMAHGLREDVEKGLKPISSKYWPEFYGYGENVDFANDDLYSLGHYACTDTDLTHRIRIVLEFMLMEDPLLYRAYRSIEVPKLRVLSDIEYRGMPIDTVYLETSLKEVDKMISEVHQELTELPAVRRFIVTCAKEALQSKLNDLQEKLDKFTEKKQKELEDKIAETPEGKKLADLKNKLFYVKNKKFYKESYPYVQPKRYFTQWQELSTGVQTIDHEVNFRSFKQMGELIYTSPVGYGNEMPVVARKVTNPETKRKETIVEKYPTTDKDELAKLPDPDGFLQKLLEYRLLVLIRDTYLDGIKARLDKDFKVHCSYPTVRSQRLSSRNPNLQNIPSRTNLDRVKGMVEHVKRMFIPAKPTQVFYQVDLSQAELRWAAYLWNVPSLIKSYKKGQDVHIVAAAMSKGWTYEQFEKYAEENPKEAAYIRFQAKAYNFGLIYGMSAESFREYCQVQYGVDMSIEEATRIRNMYLNKLHPAIPVAHEKIKQIGRQQGFIRTAFGSKRHVPYINSRNGENRSHDERVCLNSPVQGSSGQGLLFSMIVFTDWMEVLDLGGEVTNTVHDSIMGYVEAENKEIYLHWLVRACNQAPTQEYFGFDINTKVPMLSDAEVGDNWKDLKQFA